MFDKYKKPVSDGNVEKDIEKIIEVITSFNGEQDQDLNKSIKEKLRRKQLSEPKSALNVQLRKYLDNLEKEWKKYSDSSLYMGESLQEFYISWTTKPDAKKGILGDWKDHINYRCFFKLSPNSPGMREVVDIGHNSLSEDLRMDLIDGLKKMDFYQAGSNLHAINEDDSDPYPADGILMLRLQDFENQTRFYNHPSLDIFPEKSETLTYLMKYLGDKKLKS